MRVKKNGVFLRMSGGGRTGVLSEAQRKKVGGSSELSDDGDGDSRPMRGSLFPTLGEY